MIVRSQRASLPHNSVIAYILLVWQITFLQVHQMIWYNRYSGNYSVRTDQWLAIGSLMFKPFLYVSMENPCVNSIVTLVQCFSQAFDRLFCFFWAWLFPFNPLYCFIVWFRDNSNLVSLCFRLLVYNKRSPVYPALARHWQTLKGVNKSMIILSELKLPALPYVAPITAISGCQNINYVCYGHEIDRWPCGKVICHA